MRQHILGALIALFAALLLLAPGVAAAQSPALDPALAAAAKAQQKQQIEQPLNNQPVWKEVRSGVPLVTTVTGRETNVLIQSAGQTWRALHNSWFTPVAGWALIVLLLIIIAYFLVRGTMQLHGKATGRQVKRFGAWQRAIHWATAITFVILAITGLIILFGKNILLPLIGYTLFSWLSVLSKNLHNFVGVLFIICTVLMFFTFVRDNVWRAHDNKWLARFGGLFSDRDVPSGKFNGGEKLWFWGGVLVLGVIVSVTGLILDFPNFDQTRGTMQLANLIHLTVATLFMLGALGHIYMGTLGMAGAYDAMKTGYVDETWAKEHHEYWYNDIKAGKIPDAVEAPQGAGAKLAQKPA